METRMPAWEFMGLQGRQMAAKFRRTGYQPAIAKFPDLQGYCCTPRRTLVKELEREGDVN